MSERGKEDDNEALRRREHTMPELGTTAREIRWVLVSDAARARLFEQRYDNDMPREIADFPNPDGRAHNRDLVSDADGRRQVGGHGGGGQSGSHSEGPA